MKHEAEPITSFGKTYVATPAISFGGAVKNFYTQYSDFSSRSRRSEYWWAMLYVLIGEIALIYIFTFLNSDFEVFFSIASLFLFTLPTLSLSVRRLHDVDKSGWYLLLGFIPIIGGVILFIYHIRNSIVGENNWGVSPKYLEVEIPDGEV